MSQPSQRTWYVSKLNDNLFIAISLIVASTCNSACYTVLSYCDCITIAFSKEDVCGDCVCVCKDSN